MIEGGPNLFSLEISYTHTKSQVLSNWFIGGDMIAQLRLPATIVRC